jgi:crotonobetainyl-CoA:carnitine CoA-transferase CaiB-like acyl-CoA transferase
LASAAGNWLPCAPINDIAAIANDPHIAARNMIVGMKTRGGPAESRRQ